MFAVKKLAIEDASYLNRLNDLLRRLKDSFSFTKDSLHELLADNKCSLFVTYVSCGEDAGVVAGMGILDWRGLSKQARIHSIVVDLDFVKNHCATRLIKAMIAEVERVVGVSGRKIVVCLETENAESPATKLFEKNGFVLDSIRGKLRVYCMEVDC